MYVKKFEGETLDQTLQLVKKELGPDAIILKTVTHKGLKSALKKGRIEITAAISEQNYAKKAKVDQVLSEEQREQFYRSPAKDIGDTLNTYDRKEHSVSSGGYGQLGLNKVVQTVAHTTNKITSSLDDFLAGHQHKEVVRPDAGESEILTPSITSSSENSIDSRTISETRARTNGVDVELRHLLKAQANKIEQLEEKLRDLSQNMMIARSAPKAEEEAKGLKELADTLRILDLNAQLVSEIILEIHRHLSSHELNNSEIVFEEGLKIIGQMINTDRALFSKIDADKGPVYTIVISDAASGQASMVQKISTLCDNQSVITLRPQGSDEPTSFAYQMFNIKEVRVQTPAALMTELRKKFEAKESCVLDLRLQGMDGESILKTLQTIQRTFGNTEILVCLSAINSELYNKKILSKYKDIADGVIMSFVDQCMSFGELINTHLSHRELPLVFFGTGAMVPDDIEAASTDRLLASLFRL